MRGRGSLTAPGSVTDRDAAWPRIDCRADTEPRQSGCGEPHHRTPTCLTCTHSYASRSGRLNEGRAAAPVYASERNWNPEQAACRVFFANWDTENA
ncbi:hypothetical protein MRX96_036797 [Rhipicephalus microplus]